MGAGRCGPLLVVFHARIDGAGAVELFRQHQAGQLMGHRDAAHAEFERRRPLDLIGQPVGRADDEGHIPCPAACAYTPF